MSLRAALLGLLAEGPATGYGLIKEFAPSTSMVWPAPKGEIYRELARLERDGFALRGKAAGPRRQREWRITAKGQQELERWLCSGADYSLRYEPMLRAVFLATLKPSQVRKVIAADRAFFAGELATLKQSAPPGAFKSRRRYALPMVMAFYEAMLAWCDTADAIAKKA